jgi:MoaA/NifB/PqqE/SkfB family radical SAM enzyme
VWEQIAAGAKAGHLEHVRSDYSGDLLNSDKRHGGWLDRMIALDIPFEIDTHANDLTEEAAAKLIGSRLRTINFSLDTMDPEDYLRIRRGARPHAEVIANIRHFMALRHARRPDIQTMVSFVLMRRNLDSIDAALDLVKELGIGYVAGNHLHVYTPDMVEESLLLVPHRYAEACERLRTRARAMGVTLTLPEPVFVTAPGRGHVPCSVARHTALFLGNGDVMVCCMPGTKVGNLSQDSLAGIWHGAAMRTFRARVNSDDPPEPCTVCPMRRETGNLASFVPGLGEAARRDFEARCLDAVRTGA